MSKARVAASRQGRTESSRPAPRLSLEDRITGAYFQLTGGQENRRVYIADLHSRLSSQGYSKAEVNRALTKLWDLGHATLYQLDNPAEARKEEARGGVLHTGSGNPRHIVYMGRKG
jgi:hypothetical protein